MIICPRCNHTATHYVEAKNEYACVHCKFQAPRFRFIVRGKMITLEQWSNGKVCSICSEPLVPNHNKDGLQCINPVCKNYAASIAIDTWREAQAQMKHNQLGDTDGTQEATIEDAMLRYKDPNHPVNQAATMGGPIYTKEELDRMAKDQEVLQAGGTQFSTGAVRSSDKAGVRYDLITPIGLRRIAETYKEGYDKYGPFNWERGMPISDILNHTIAHIYQFLSGVESGEDDLAHAAWNLLAAMHMQETHPNLDHELRTPCTQKTSE